MPVCAAIAQVALRALGSPAAWKTCCAGRAEWATPRRGAGDRDWLAGGYDFPFPDPRSQVADTPSSTRRWSRASAATRRTSTSAPFTDRRAAQRGAGVEFMSEHRLFRLSLIGTNLNRRHRDYTSFLRYFADEAGLGLSTPLLDRPRARGTRRGDARSPTRVGRPAPLDSCCTWSPCCAFCAGGVNEPHHHRLDVVRLRAHLERMTHIKHEGALPSYVRARLMRDACEVGKRSRPSAAPVLAGTRVARRARAASANELARPREARRSGGSEGGGSWSRPREPSP
jgi:hypothetical protein